MPAGQQIPQDAASPANGHSTVHDLFALTDEQILEIEPEAQDSARSGELRAANEQPTRSASQSASAIEQKQEGRAPDSSSQTEAASSSSSASHQSLGTSHAAQEPPAWLAAQMKDPWTGEEARELWNGVQQAKSEAAAYREAFANPQDARALKELYPGGVNEARAAAERARVLDDIDRSYFGVTGKPAQEVSASRAELAQRMLRENPAAFREMVFAGLRALEESGQATGQNVVAQAGIYPDRVGRPEGVSSIAAPAAANRKNLTPAGVSHGEQQSASGAYPRSAAASSQSQAGEHEARLAAYASFEKAANEDLERSVGGTIERTLLQALPSASRMSNASGAGAQHAAPLQARLSAAIRQDVEAALKGDRQLGEQVAQILSGRRLDEETRAQVVRLIGERAQQLVPVAAKRVLNDWTQTTLATHRGNTVRTEAANARREVAPASLPASSSTSSGRSRGEDHALAPNNAAARSDPRRVDYRKLSDEQILDL